MAKNNIKVEKGAFEYKGKTYSEYFICGNVRGRDVKDTGEVYESAVKPARNSDKTLLAMLMR